MRQRFSNKTPQPEIAQPQIKLSKPEMIRKQLTQIEQSIINKLQSKEIQIAKTKIPFLSEKEKISQEESAYQKLIQQRKKMQQKIKQLQNTQKQYLSKSRVNDKSHSATKNELTETDKAQLKMLRKKLIDFQKSIQKKNIQIEQQKLRILKQQEQKLIKQRNAINEIKKLKIQQKLQQIKHRQIQRESKKVNDEKQLRKIQQKKKLHELLDQNWKEKNNKEEQRKLELMEMRKKQKFVDFGELKEHQKKYKEIMMDKKKQLFQKRLNSSRKSHNSSFQESKYYTILVREQNEAKQQEEKKKQRGKLIQKKRLQYSSYVRQEFAPKAKSVSDEEAQQKLQQPTKIIRLTKQEIKQIGNLNLQKGNRRIKKKQNNQVEEMERNAASTISQYPDYLKELRKKKQEQNYYSGFYNSPKAQAEKIMKSNKIKKQDKIAKLKLLAQRFDTNSKDIVAKIQGKLQILQVIN